MRALRIYEVNRGGKQGAELVTELELEGLMGLQQFKGLADADIGGNRSFSLRSRGRFLAKVPGSAAIVRRERIELYSREIGERQK